MIKIFSKKSAKAFTLVELLLSIFILAIISITLFEIFNNTLKLIIFKKKQTEAIALSNEKIEIFRSVKYNDLGTISGIPAGNFPQTENQVINGTAYTINTSIVYIDDPFDGLQGEDPDDTLNTDYKQIKIKITWTGGPYNYVQFITNIAPAGIETSAGGGTLKINVFNANGEPVPAADVNILNTNLSPNINIATTTNANGLVVLPGAPIDGNFYQISVQKTGYNSAQTYAAEALNPNPAPEHLAVFESQTTPVSFGIDLLADLSVITLKQNGENLDNLPFNIHGDKIKGLENDGGQIYKYDADFITNASSTSALSDLEWDSYTIFFDESAIGWDVSEINPPLTAGATNVMPASDNSIIFYFTPHATNTLRVTVRDQTKHKIQDASVRLYKPAISYDETINTGVNGQSFFSPLASTNYNLSVTKEGFLDYEILIDPDGGVSVNGNNKLEVEMTGA